MKLIKHEIMLVQCNHCKASFESDSVKEFKEFNTIPPSIGFMCAECGNLAKIHFSDIPNRIKAKLVTKVSNEIMAANGNGYKHPMYKQISPYLNDQDLFDNHMIDI